MRHQAHKQRVLPNISNRSGILGLSAHATIPGLQALVRLYYSSPQQLGYDFPTLQAAFQLQDGRVILPTGRLAPVCQPVSVSSRGADVHGSADEMHVVIRTTHEIALEVSCLLLCCRSSLI